MTFSILIAEDEDITLKHLVSTLQKEGYEVTGTRDGLDALRKSERTYFDLVIADLKMPGLSGLDLLEGVKQRHPDAEVIMITGLGSIGSAVEAMKKGAYDYITKPFDLDELLLTVRKIQEKKELKRENTALKAYYAMDRQVSIIAESDSMKKILTVIEDLKDSSCNVLLTGESGVGKSLLAKIIHFTSGRQHLPFLSINCPALTEELLASELFGHEKGAFTGAVKEKQGLLEIADTGSIFLDEIAEMSPNIQAKLLKVIEEGEFFRVGGTKPIRVDVRFIAATNQDTKTLISKGRFREDLYYRLNVMEIYTPPLRERKKDVVPLSRYFLQKHLPKSNKKISGFTREAIDTLINYSFPGNVRELQNIIERAIILEKGSLITAESLPTSIIMFQAETLDQGHIRTLEALNKEYVEKVLEMMGGNKSKAAEVLGISRTSLWRILRET